MGNVIVGDPAIISRLRFELAEKQSTVDALMKGFLQTDFPSIDGLAFDVHYKPAAVLDSLGGDWYDVFVLPDGRVAFSIGDICGKGLGAAVKMGQAKQAIKVAASLKNNNPQPLAVLNQANQVIFLNGHDVQLTTAIYGIIDVSTRSVRYASAGHHPPILGKHGRKPTVMPNYGFPLGVETNLPELIHEHTFTYESGSMLVLYTDGLIEFNHDIEEGEAKLLKAVHNAIDANTAHPAQFIFDHVMHGDVQHIDDVAVLTVSFR